MDPLLEIVDLDMEENNELLFKVKIEGADPAPARVRLVCESGDLAYMFNGRLAGQDGLIQFNLPVMKDKLKEGIYQSRVEVLVDNRYFAPVQFQINFKKAVKVVAEAVFTRMPIQKPDVNVTAQIMTKQALGTIAPPTIDLPVIIEAKQEVLEEAPQEKMSQVRLNATTLRDRYRNRK